VAYRLLGRLDEVDDAVQESWLRLSGSDPSSIANLGAWLMTVVARVCLDMLRARHARREESLEASVPVPITSRKDDTLPEEEAELADSVGLALLVVLEQLAPAERLAFVLHDLFAVPFDEIAPLVERSTTATRQLAEQSWMPSSPPRAKVPSTRCWQCSTRMSWPEPTAQPCPEARQGRSVGRRP
jgi:RNA polymerase sigma factor (sigma-70 family)